MESTVPYIVVAVATKNMDPSMKIGKGAFSVVYLGEIAKLRQQRTTKSKLRVSTESEDLEMEISQDDRWCFQDWPDNVAVKVMKHTETSSSEKKPKHKQKASLSLSTDEELKVIRKLTHKHMCCLLGWSMDGPSQCLVFEYCAGGSLEDRLKGKVIDRRSGRPFPPLIWQHRLRLFAQLGAALQYLHCIIKPAVFHR